MRQKLFLMTTDGELHPIHDDAIEILFDNCPEKTPQEVGVKLMLSMSLYGINAAITQDIAKRAGELAKDFVG